MYVVRAYSRSAKREEGGEAKKTYKCAPPPHTNTTRIYIRNQKKGKNPYSSSIDRCVSQFRVKPAGFSFLLFSSLHFLLLFLVFPFPPLLSSSLLFSCWVRVSSGTRPNVGHPIFFSLPSSLPAHLSRHIRRRRPDKTWSCQFHFFVLCPI